MKIILSAVFVAGIALTQLITSKCQAAPDAQQALQGLFTGDPKGDRSLIDAFQRGYQRGREDEAEAQKQRDEAQKKAKPR
jgi:hypothetical protein